MLKEDKQVVKYFLEKLAEQKRTHFAEFIALHTTIITYLFPSIASEAFLFF